MRNSKGLRAIAGAACTILGAAVCVVLASCTTKAAPPVQAAAAGPDYIIYNAKLVTVDAKFSIASAAAVANGRFTLVGNDKTVLAAAGSATKRIDMGGKTILPGFNDTHLHLSQAKVFDTLVNLTNITSIKDIQSAIAARAAKAAKGEWIFGSRGWWEYKLAEGRVPTREDLDQAAPHNPVVIPGPHYAIANSLALQLAGIDKHTPDPQGGEIWKDARTGELTGLLMDTATRAVTRFAAEPDMEQQLAGMRTMLKTVNGYGLTSVGDPGGSVADAQLYRRLYDASELTVRIDFSYSIDPALPLQQIESALRALPAPGTTWGEGMFRSDELGEVGLDGAELSALLREDYPGKPGYRGLRIVPVDQYNQFAALANRYGWRIRPHAVGDAAIDQALGAFAFAHAQKPLADRRWMIDHAFLLRPDHYAKIKELGVIINSQYMHNYQLGALILKAWRRPLADQSERYKDWVEHGILFANGSDGPIAYYPQPLLYIYGSVTRATDWGGSLGAEQGLSVEDAIRSVTINGAYTTFEEKTKGSIEPGKYADFIVLSDDILTMPHERIKDIRVEATVLGGKPVFGMLRGL